MPDQPKQGDIVIVRKSWWYALKDGEKMQVTESHWGMERISLIPKKGLYGNGSYFDAGHMSTSGGPFISVKPGQFGATFRKIGQTTNRFWKWIDIPRAGGGRSYEMTVDLWELDELHDRHGDENGCERYCKCSNLEPSCL